MSDDIHEYVLVGTARCMLAIGVLFGAIMQSWWLVGPVVGFGLALGLYSLYRAFQSWRPIQMTLSPLNPAGVEAAWLAGGVALHEHAPDIGKISRAAIVQVVLEAALPAYLATSLPPHDGEVGLVERLRVACVGHPYATIAWPHRVLHEAADAITSLSQRLAVAEARATAAYNDGYSARDAVVDACRARLAAVEAERDEATKLNNKYAWERDKAREERDAAERRSEAFWKPQLQAAEAQLAHARKAAIEECAKVADNHGLAEDGDPDCQGCGEKIAAALRALGGGK